MLARLATTLTVLAGALVAMPATTPAASALPPPSAPPASGAVLLPVTNTERPSVEGRAREGQRLRAHPGRWTPQREETRYRWLRDGRPIRGAKARSYRLVAADIGSRIAVQVRVRAEGYSWGSAESKATREVAHRVPVRRRVTYNVITRGTITTSVKTFKRQAQETFDDPRGWRAGGIEFRRVARGGQFTLVLAQAARVTDYSSTCSTMWSCRVGRYVIINQDRWKFASPAWNAARQSLRDYRHMVLNHETGHWLGRGHASCPAPGQKAPVMQQQSKSLMGCRFNPWPLPGER